MAQWGEVRYARNDGTSIAYRVGGEGPFDLLFIPGFVSHVELAFELPAARSFFDRLASFARVIFFDKRGMGLSYRGAGAYTIEKIANDAIAVLDAVGSEQAALFGDSEGGPAAVMIAAAHPERVSSMVLSPALTPGSPRPTTIPRYSPPAARADLENGSRASGAIPT